VTGSCGRTEPVGVETDGVHEPLLALFPATFSEPDPDPLRQLPSESGANVLAVQPLPLWNVK
jgi:hypothetical protein